YTTNLGPTRELTIHHVIDQHTSAQTPPRIDPTNVYIPRTEYESLLRTSREFEALKSALFRGGVTSGTLDLLISGTSDSEVQRTDSATPHAWADDFEDKYSPEDKRNVASQYPEMPWRQNDASFNLAPGSGPLRNGQHDARQTIAGAQLNVPGFSRQVSSGATLSSVPDEGAFGDAESFDDVGNHGNVTHHGQPAHEQRTLYLSGFSERSTFRDLISVIKGGKLLSVSLRPERTATVTFLDPHAASSFLAWTKRHDIYLHSKRIEVRWADHQYRLNSHILNKVNNGATRNILVHDALSRGLTEAQIREDMEHIHNLVIIDVVFRNGDAYIATSAVHNALFARTCMMSRTRYKGCKIEFFRDECDIPLPADTASNKAPVPRPGTTKAHVANRFDLLNIDGSDEESDEENRLPVNGGSDDESSTLDLGPRNTGVSLHFLDADDV
ncbi:RNA recognition motif, partial [Teratosphaeria destructans]